MNDYLINPIVEWPIIQSGISKSIPSKLSFTFRNFVSFNPNLCLKNITYYLIIGFLSLIYYTFLLAINRFRLKYLNFYSLSG